MGRPDSPFIILCPKAAATSAGNFGYQIRSFHLSMFVSNQLIMNLADGEKILDGNNQGQTTIYLRSGVLLGCPDLLLMSLPLRLLPLRWGIWLPSAYFPFFDVRISSTNS